VELNVPGNSSATGLLPGGSEANEQIDVTLVVDVDVSVTENAATIDLSISGLALP
jgi:hypothetical protein